MSPIFRCSSPALIALALRSRLAAIHVVARTAAREPQLRLVQLLGRLPEMLLAEKLSRKRPWLELPREVGATNPFVHLGDPLDGPGRFFIPCNIPYRSTQNVSIYNYI